MSPHVVLFFAVSVAFLVELFYLALMMGTLRCIERAVDQIVTATRLSVLIKVEGKKDLRIEPEDLEPKKEVLRAALLKRLYEEDHPDPDTWAYCILDHAGLNLFVEGQLFQRLKKVLGRFRANGDMDGAERFVNNIVDAL